MNEHLQTILNFIQQAQHLSDEEKIALSKAAKTADKELEITAFKLDRTEKVKHTTAILLEETIAELEQKRKAVEAQNKKLEIETSLERVRTAAMAMHTPDDLLGICEILFKELQTLGFSSLRNAMINVYNDDQGFFLNYDFSGCLGPSITKFSSYDCHPLIENITKQIRKASDAFAEISVTGDELASWKEFRNKNGELPDPELENSTALYYYFYSVGTAAVGISTYRPVSNEEVEILKRFRNVFDLAYRRYIDITKAEAQSKEAQIELALERVRAKTMAMQKSDELSETVYILFQQFKELGENPDQATIGIINENEWVIEYWVTMYGTQTNRMYKFPIDEPNVTNKIYQAWKEQKKSLVIELSGKELYDFSTFRESMGGAAYNEKEKKRVINVAFFSRGLINVQSNELRSAESIRLLERFAGVFEQTYTRFLDLQKAEAQAREAEIELGLERVRARAMAMQKSAELSELVNTVFKELTKLDFALTWCIINIIDESSMSNTVWAASPDINKAPESYHMKFEDYPFHHAMMKGWKERKAKSVYTLAGDEKRIYDDYLFSETEFKRTPEVAQAASRALEKYVVSFSFSNFGGLQTVGDAPLSDANLDILSRFGKVFDLTYTRFNDLKQAEAQAREAQIELALERVRARTMAMQKSEELKEVIQLVYEQFVHLNIHVEHTGFVMDYKARDDYDIWIADQLGVPSHVTIPYFDCVYYNRFNEAKKKGEDFFATNLDFEEKNRFYKKIIEHVPGLPEETKEFLFNIPGLAGSTVLLDNVCLYIENFSGIPFSDDENNTLMRFGKVFQQTYTRFLDLKKAEAQAREAKIELALERVRAQTMAMHKSEELLEIMAVMFEQLAQLQLRTDAITLSLEYKTKLLNLWMAIPGQTYPVELKIPYINIPFINSAMKAVRSGDNFYSITCGLEEKNRWIHHLFEHTIVKNTPEARKQFLLQAPGLALSLAMGKNIALLVANYAAVPFSAEENAIIKRFVKVFEQSYTRFLDLQKAEAQGRESQIQLALERVRARTMAMQHSDELKGAAALLFQQVKSLGAPAYSCGYNIWEKNEKEFTSWMSTQDGSIINGVPNIPLTEDANFIRYVESKQNGEQFFVLELRGERMQEHYKYLKTIPAFKAYFDYAINVGFDLPKTQIHHLANFSHGNLLFITLEPCPEFHDVFKRFAAVFEQTYTRFLDLQKAEAQAREAQIELGLERVRSRAMAMHISNELSELVAILFEELVKLDLILARCIIWIFDKETLAARMWMANSEDKRNANSYYIKRLNHPYYEAIIKGWEEKNSKWIYVLEGNFKKSLDELLLNETELTNLPAAVKAGIRLSERTVISGSFNNFGFIEASGPVAHSNEQLEILNRFGKVFDLSYTRFSDLQKAEAQAREATIEAALEKVRGKAMAMRNSDDLSSTASMVFTELRKLGINPIRSGVGIISKKSRKVQFYSATSSANGDSLSLTGSVVMSGHPEFEKQYESWLRKENYFTVLKGEELRSYYTFLSTGLNIAPELNNQNDEKQYGHWLMFSEGFLFAWSEKEYSETEIKILERFKTIVELTFRRYIELKKSEASARDAIKQAALDRIRADIASMRTISDLDRITPLIWNELTILGIPFNRCGVFIMDDLHELIHTFLSEPDGKAIAAFHIPYDTPGSINQVLNHWQQKENYIDHWDEISFAEFANTLVKQGALASSGQYLQTIPHGGFYLHFLPFLQGMLYVGNPTRLGEEDIKLIQSVADAFSTAYARYEDFNKLEAAKQQVDKTLVDLKQAQTQLVQSEKMASLGELTAGIAHEIQNPLNFVNNFSEVNKELLAELNEEIEKGNYEEVKIIANDVIGNEEKINHHGKRADAIVKGMLQHSRSSTGAKEPTDINALADEYLRLSYHGLRAKDKSFNAEMKTDFDQNVGKINIVPQDIGRVLLNLYNNAFYAVNEKKKACQAVAVEAGYEPTVSVSTKKKDNKAILTVMDNGNGIPQKVLDKIFQPFFTTKPTGEGTGLGLSLSYDIIKAHGGEIKVETKEGEETIFVIQLSIS